MATGKSKRGPRFARFLLAGNKSDPLVVLRSATWNYNSIGLFAESEALVVDPGLSPAELALLHARLTTVESPQAPRRISHMVLTHAHHDHIRGGASFEDARVWMPRIAAEKGPEARGRILAAGKALGQRISAEPPDYPWPIVHETFETKTSFVLGGELEVHLHFLPGHSNCTSVVVIPALATLLSADYLVSPGVPFCRHEARMFEGALVDLAELVERYSIERLVPSHGPMHLGRAAIDAAISADRSVMAAMRRAVRRALDTGLSEQKVKAAALAAADTDRGRDAGRLAAQDMDNARRILREEQG